MDIIDIQHRDYDKLTDDIEFLGHNLLLRLNVALSKRDKNGTRHFYHKEFMYKSDKYIDSSNLITMRRSFEYYLTIENIVKVDGIRESIMIKNQDIMNIRMALNTVTSWFSSNAVFDIRDGNYIIKGTHEPYIIRGLAANKQIMIVPTIVKYENSSMPGIRMFLNSDSNYTDININKVMSLHYIIHTIDLFASAQMLLAYHQRPPSGEEVVTFEDSGYVDESYGMTECKSNRKIPNKRNSTSYFDRIDDM